MNVTHLFPESVQSGPDLSSEDALRLLQLQGQRVVELVLPDHVLGSVAKSRPVELRGQPRQHRAEVLQVVDHNAQLQEDGSRVTEVFCFFFERGSLFARTHHVDGAGRVRVFRQQPDPPLQDVTVIHHNLAHILQQQQQCVVSVSHSKSCPLRVTVNVCRWSSVPLSV